MNGIFIIYGAALESAIMTVLEKNQLKHYTKFPYLHGIGGHSEPQLDTQIWPGSNIGLLLVIENDRKKQLLADLTIIKKEHSEDGLKVFILPVEVAL